MSIVGALYMLAAASDGQAGSEVASLLNITGTDLEAYKAYTHLIDSLLKKNKMSYTLNIGMDAHFVLIVLQGESS